MTAGPEKQFENQIKKFLDKLPKTWYFKFWAGPYSKSGIPDIIGCVNGKFIALEVKAENGRASELQKRNIRLIEQCGGYARIVYPKDFEKLKEELIKL
ncbi:MAG: VRR-NUC domain-containing protein [Clostridium sp.]|uniref:VRR-NUC domain-containing protein n=1 Tax=Clostridium sp. TaxID=1506 RepID=UPI002A87D8EA|nr:VRR-NUC domain-containing protein [Clostridium sp.]MDY5098542.1 VRR-NUC domain-containing protein [Clostridium sp.]